MTDPGPTIPTAEDFTRWGTAATGNNTPSTGATFLAAKAATLGIGLASGAAAGGALLGAFAALPASASFTLMSTIFPSFGLTFSQTVFLPAAAQTFATATTAASASQYTITGFASTGLSAAAVVTVVAVIVAALAIAITRIIQVVQDGSVGQTLLDNKQKALGAVDAAALLRTADGMRSLLFAVQSITTSTLLERAVGAPLPAADGRYLLSVGSPNPGSTFSRADKIDFLYTNTPRNAYDVDSLRLTGGWWTDPRNAPVLRVPAQAFVASLWDPNPRISGGVATDRSGFSYDAEIQTVKVADRLRFLVTALGRGDRPVAGSTCSDYDRDGCWITDDLPLYDANARKQIVRLTLNQATAFDILGSRTAAQQSPVTLSAQLDGQPYTRDRDGDAVKLTWSVSGCATCPTGSGTSFEFTPSDPGPATVVATATDALGATTTSSVTIDVTDAPPVLTLDSTSVTGTRAAPVSIGGTAWDGGVQGPVTTTVDWGDGSPVQSIDVLLLRSNGRWGVATPYGTHLYAARGSYTATVTSSSGQTPTSKTVDVTIGNSKPTIAWAGTAPFSPVSWASVAPGTTLSATGQVTDADTDQPITLTVRWYDGTTENKTLPPNGSAVRGFTLTRVVRTSTRSFIGTPYPPRNLLEVSAVDTDPTSPVTLNGQQGTVDDAAPNLNAVNAVGGRVDSATTVTGLATDPNGRPTSVYVRWNDGTDPPFPVQGEQYPVEANGTFSASHTYATPGSHTATITANDGDDDFGQRTTRTLTFEVGEQLPLVASVSPPQGNPRAGAFGGSFIVKLNRAGTVTFDPGDGRAPITSSWPPVTGLDFLFFVTAYDRPGVYNARLTATEDGKDPVEVPLSPITVINTPPTVTTPTAATGTEGQAINVPLEWRDIGLTGTGTVDVSWGDGQSSSFAWPAPVPGSLPLSQAKRVSSPAHTYADPGDYSVQITVTDQDGAVVTTETTASIANVAPVLGTVAVTPARAGSTTTLVAPVTDPGGGPGQLTVDWGDGSGTSTTYGPDGQARTSHTYADAGTYTATVSATDSAGASTAPTVVEVAVANSKPTVTLAPPGSVTEGSLLSVELTVSDSPADSGTASVDWGDGTSTTGLAWDDAHRTLSVTHVYADDDPTGTSSDPKRIAAVVTDLAGARGRAGRSVSVKNASPTLESLLSDPGGRPVTPASTLPLGTAVTLAGGILDPGVPDSHTATVDWGDGTTGPLVVSDRQLSAQHTYLAGGTHRVLVRVRDDDGGVRQKAYTIVVADSAAMVAAATARMDGIADSMAPGSVRTRLRDAIALIESSPLPTGRALVDGPPEDLAAALAATADATSEIEDVAASLDRAALTVALRRLVLVARGLVQLVVEEADQSDQRVTDTRAALEAADRLLGEDDLGGAAAGYADAYDIFRGPPTGTAGSG